jgi:hypothetical protein
MADRKGVGAAFKDLIGALIGISTYSDRQTTPIYGLDLDDPAVIKARENLGGNLEAIPHTRTRWYTADIERAQNLASNGDLTMVGQLAESMKIDGVVRGLSDARTSVADFPKRFYGSREVTETLLSRNSSDRDVYEEMIPSTEARLMMYDGFMCGVAVGEMVPVAGRNFPVLVRRYPQNLYYIWASNTWYYRSVIGLIPITGRIGIPDESGSSWVLHIPGGRLSPWNNGLWNTCGRSYINKTQSLYARQNYIYKHSQPARVAESPIGSNETERKGLLNSMINWALNAVYVLPAGYKMTLVESKGEGYQVYQHDIDTCNQEIATSLCGSAVMLQGTTGFTNLDVFRVVQKDLIKGTSSPWDWTVNTQIIPAYVGQRWGIDALTHATTVETDIEAPKDRAGEANTMVALANGIKGMVEALKEAQAAAGVGSDGKQVPIAIDYKNLLTSFGIKWIDEGAPIQLTLRDPVEAAARLGELKLAKENGSSLPLVATRFASGDYKWAA